MTQTGKLYMGQDNALYRLINTQSGLLHYDQLKSFQEIRYPKKYGACELYPHTNSIIIHILIPQIRLPNG